MDFGKLELGKMDFQGKKYGKKDFGRSDSGLWAVTEGAAAQRSNFREKLVFLGENGISLLEIRLNFCSRIIPEYMLGSKIIFLTQLYMLCMF